MDPAKLPGSEVVPLDNPVEAVAIRLYNLYRHEVIRFRNNRQLSDGIFDMGKWETKLREPASKAGCENVEESPVKSGQRDHRNQVWRPLARKVLQDCIDPESYIRSQFRTVPLTSRHPPAPNHMIGARAQAKYVAGLEAFVEDVRIAFGTQQEAARSEMAFQQSLCGDKVEAWARVLEDDDAGMTALFRYCLALGIYQQLKDERFLAIAGSYQTTAGIQYCRHPDVYDKIWGKNWIPRGFRDKADLIYRTYYNIG